MSAVAGVVVTPLAVIPDERGAVRHFLRADAGEFAGFGEVYFSEVLPGKVKAWRRHQRATSCFTVPVGAARLVLFDARPGSASHGVTQELELDARSPARVLVPPGIWTGFQGLTAPLALVANVVSLPHDPAESDRRAPDDPELPHVWAP